MTYLRQASKVLFKRNAMPEQLVLFVTSQCNMTCDHCFYWRSLNQDESPLTTDEIQRISQRTGRFSHIVLTGGEPFLRDDLEQIALAFYRNSKVDVISICTNGFDAETIARTVNNVARCCRRATISIVVSIDGDETLHDSIRGTRSYARAVRTIQTLLASKPRFPNLNVEAAITMSRRNQAEVATTYRTLRDAVAPDTITLSLIRGDAKAPDINDVDIELYRNACLEIEEDMLEGTVSGYRNFAVSAILTAMKGLLWRRTVETYRTNRYIAPCYSGLLNAVIYPNGDVHPCELLDEKMGSLRDADYDLRALWRSEKARAVREEIKVSRCRCFHDCALTINILFNPRDLARLLLRATLRSRRSSARPSTGQRTKTESTT